MADETALAEATMIYRKPAKDSDPLAIQDIWGKALEARTVDASEVEDFLAEGWVTHPSHIDHPPKPEEAAGFEPVPSLRAELEATNKRADSLAKELEATKAAFSKLAEDLKAAEELAAAESKAKDEALARLDDLDQAKTTLTPKK